jgi:hypothetical protein
VDGTPFGRYRLQELLGRGGMGEVWKAYDPTMDRMVALKLLSTNFATDRVFQERFRREARAASGLDDPHVVPFYDFGEIEGQLYVTMRLINGRDLHGLLADGPLPPARAVAIVEQIASALHAAHEIGLVHRDVKPSNILVAKDDFSYLIDFGIARAAGQTGLTDTGATIGTWGYMAPERLNTGQAEPSADIYALACVLHEMLTGQPPYPGDSLEQQIVGHLTTPPPRPSVLQAGVPEALDVVIAKGMAKQPDERYATTVELARGARDAVTVGVPSAVPAAPAYAPIRPDRPTELAAASAAPAPQPPLWAGPPPQAASPAPKRRLWRPAVLIPVLAAVAVLIGAGVFTIVKLHNPSAASTHEMAPFTGTYTAAFDADTNSAGKPELGAAPATGTWAVRSACRSTGCVATATAKGQPTLESTFVFDDVGGQWIAVGADLVTSPPTVPGFTGCVVPHEYWEVITLKPRSDGTLAGNYMAVDAGGCYTARNVTFTRIGDVDGTGPADPAGQPPRMASPAEALHGRYRDTINAANGVKRDADVTVSTDCVRSGDRCLSLTRDTSNLATEVLVFGSGKWTVTTSVSAQCKAGGNMQLQRTAEFSLPAPPQTSITLLTGHGHEEVTGCATGGVDFEQRLERTGD